MRFALALGVAALLAATACQTLADAAPVAENPASARSFADLEARSGGRMGVALVDQNGRWVAGHRPREAFAFCSTFKLPLAALVLEGARSGRWSLDDPLPIEPSDLVAHSPATEAHVERGWISLREAARAIVTVSDNAAANLLLERVGGVQAFNRWIREHGDPATRLDRLEPELNDNRRGDPRDTTRPADFARLVASLILGNALQDEDRDQLRDWLVESRTGLARIRAGLPEGWRAGDKTGTCGFEGRESYNDVAFIFPPADQGEAHVLLVFLDRPTVDPGAANRQMAEVGRAAVSIIRAGAE